MSVHQKVCGERLSSRSTISHTRSSDWPSTCHINNQWTSRMAEKNKPSEQPMIATQHSLGGSSSIETTKQHASIITLTCLLTSYGSKKIANGNGVREEVAMSLVECTQWVLRTQNVTTFDFCYCMFLVPRRSSTCAQSMVKLQPPFKRPVACGVCSRWRRVSPMHGRGGSVPNAKTDAFALGYHLYLLQSVPCPDFVVRLQRNLDRGLRPNIQHPSGWAAGTCRHRSNSFIPRILMHNVPAPWTTAGAGEFLLHLIFLSATCWVWPALPITCMQIFWMTLSTNGQQFKCEKA